MSSFFRARKKEDRKKAPGIFLGASFRLASSGPAELAASRLRQLRPELRRRSLSCLLTPFLSVSLENSEDKSRRPRGLPASSESRLRPRCACSRAVLRTSLRNCLRQFRGRLPKTQSVVICAVVIMPEGQNLGAACFILLKFECLLNRKLKLFCGSHKVGIYCFIVFAGYGRCL